jgi:hypothetical protein
MVIPPAAVQAAARAIHEHDKLDPWDDEGCNDSGDGAFTSCKDWTLQAASVALEAALPHLRLQETLDAKAEAWEEGWRRGVRDANRPEASGTDNPYRKAADNG